MNLVRDIAGAVTVVLPDGLLDAQEKSQLAKRLHELLGGYSLGPNRVLLEHADLINAEDILNSPYRVQVPDEEDIYLIDRLLTNQEWLGKPMTDALPLPTAAVFSIKGGVGRSTALAAWAWSLARQGKRVLVIDLDLEAPGISSLLLDKLPKYGLVDWLVESLANQANEALLDDMLLDSPLNQECDGVIQVIPAYGNKTLDYVAKLGRVYVPTMDAQGTLFGLAQRLNALLHTVAKRLSPPDVVLLDTRAGLHDIGAAVLSQLPTKVLLFARDEQQTWEAYEHLFHHLRQAHSVEWGMPDWDLRWRLKMVAAQLGGSQGDVDLAIGASYRVWTEFYDESSAGKDLLGQSFQEFDEAAPHFPIPVYHETLLARKSLIDPAQRPPWEVVERAFGHFTTKATEWVLSP
ncbi:MAG: AAA family ATPase [Magnetococcales bacterium]|nr:AAA family ATPase [Magnetococcales bacterium]